MRKKEKTLSIQVPQPVITNVEKVLRTNGVAPKSTENLVKLYVLLKTINGMGLINLPYDDLVAIAYSGHRTRLTKGLKTLVDAGLLRTRLSMPQLTKHRCRLYSLFRIQPTNGR